MKTFVRFKFVPIILCLLSLGLLCSSAVAKGATVEKASAGQVNLLQCEMVQVPAPAPDIAAALSVTNPLVLSEEEAIPATKNADIALVSGSMKSNSVNKTATATSSPPAVQDFECAITHVAVAKYGLVVTHQPCTSVVRT